MERSLSLILNGGQSDQMPLSGTIMLTLVTMELKELDMYICKNFNSSSDVRAKYAAQIEPFLEQHKSLIERVERETGRKFRGSIVITELSDGLILERKKVIYKKDMVVFNRITRYKSFLLALERRDYLNSQRAGSKAKGYERIFSDFYSQQLRFYCHTDSRFKKVSGSWRMAIKESSRYYDIIRMVIKAYESRYKELNLPSIDVLYSEYLKEISARKNSNAINDSPEELEDIDLLTGTDRLTEDLRSHMDDYKEPKRYKTYADEEGYPGDLDDGCLDRMPGEEDLTSVKTKVLDNGQLTFF
ncbi:MAG: hypothetical protein E7173_03325 [Firmicutes bacterium]|nr:hypothetical protein [Bacillota bacterium]